MEKDILNEVIGRLSRTRAVDQAVPDLFDLTEETGLAFLYDSNINKRHLWGNSLIPEE